MTTLKTNLGTQESARHERFEPSGALTATNVQKAIEQVEANIVAGTGDMTKAVYDVGNDGIIDVSAGGTGLASYTTGDLLYASSGTVIARLADAATGNALISGGAGVAPSYGKVGLTTHVSGVLPVANGGTNASSASGTALDNISGFASTGMLARTASGTYAFRSLTAPAAGFTISNIDGVAGNPTFTLMNDLAALEALSGTNTIYYRSGTDTWTAVTIGSGLTFAGGSLAATGGAGTGDFSSNTGTSVVGELVVFADTSGKLGKRSTGDGYAKLTSGVMSAQATPIPVADGGTAIASYAVGDLLYASGATTISKLADVATGNALISGGVTTAPSYGKIGLTTHVSGVLPIANGGTNASSASGTALDNITGFASTGMLARTAGGTYAFRTLTGTANKVSITNGDGVSGNPTITAGTDMVDRTASCTLTVGYNATSFSIGTVTGANQTITPTYTNGNFQHATLNGSSLTGTLTFDIPSSASASIVVEVTNGGSGAVGATLSTSNYTKVTGDTYATTNGNKYLFFCTRSQTYKHLHIQALQ